MFIFYFLGVGPPCCLILCQFWLCEEAQCVYLRRHLSCGFCNKLPQTRWLETTKTYSFTVLEAASPKLRSQQGCPSSRCSREDSIPCLFHLLVSCQYSLAYGHIIPISVSMVTLSPPFLSVLHIFTF